MIYLAPLQGYTEVEFRRAWSSFFTGLDAAVSPFIPLAEGFRFRNAHLSDVLPSYNTRIPVIPQVLGTDADKFAQLACRLQELGYKSVNWNLGCPKHSVARKKRGSGILPHPDEIRRVLDALMPQLSITLSVKTRLGYHSPGEFGPLVEVFNDYPLESVMIHPRIGEQMYQGEMHLDALDRHIGRLKHRLVFSGDIASPAQFRALKERYPMISDWMLGRGVLVNPFLPEMIRNTAFAADKPTIRKRQKVFHEELLCEMRDKFKRDRSILNKMKDYWSYFSRWFTDEQEIFSRLAHLQSLPGFIHHTRIILEEQPLAPLENRSNEQVRV